MTQNNSHDRDEQRLADVLQAVNADVPPPDRERLAALREQSTAAFGEPAGVSPRTQPTEGPGADALRLAKDTSDKDLKRNTPMMTLALRSTVRAALRAARGPVAERQR